MNELKYEEKSSLELQIQRVSSSQIDFSFSSACPLIDNKITTS